MESALADIAVNHGEVSGSDDLHAELFPAFHELRLEQVDQNISRSTMRPSTLRLRQSVRLANFISTRSLSHLQFLQAEFGSSAVRTSCTFFASLHRSGCVDYFF
jgi:hypothetical protein